jgi:hypothetical protein
MMQPNSHQKPEIYYARPCEARKAVRKFPRCAARVIDNSRTLAPTERSTASPRNGRADRRSAKVLRSGRSSLGGALPCRNGTLLVPEQLELAAQRVTGPLDGQARR